METTNRLAVRFPQEPAGRYLGYTKFRPAQKPTEPRPHGMGAAVLVARFLVARFLVAFLLVDRFFVAFLAAFFLVDRFLVVLLAVFLAVFLRFAISSGSFPIERPKPNGSLSPGRYETGERHPLLRKTVASPNKRLIQAT